MNQFNALIDKFDMAINIIQAQTIHSCHLDLMIGIQCNPAYYKCKCLESNESSHDVTMAKLHSFATIYYIHCDRPNHFLNRMKCHRSAEIIWFAMQIL